MPPASKVATWQSRSHPVLGSGLWQRCWLVVGCKTPRLPSPLLLRSSSSSVKPIHPIEADTAASPPNQHAPNPCKAAGEDQKTLETHTAHPGLGSVIINQPRPVEADCGMLCDHPRHWGRKKEKKTWALRLEDPNLGAAQLPERVKKKIPRGPSTRGGDDPWAVTTFRRESAGVSVSSIIEQSAISTSTDLLRYSISTPGMSHEP